VNALPVLSVPGEEVWLSLRYHVEWAEGFALIVLFSSTPAVHDVLRERLEQSYRTRVSHLQQVTPCSAETLIAEIMSLIRTPSELYEHARAPLWLDLSARPHDTAWQQARDNLLARLNEHRELQPCAMSVSRWTVSEMWSGPWNAGRKWGSCIGNR
jgi:hypothetical protein